MHERRFERFGGGVGVVGMDTWQSGADWGSVDPGEAVETLGAAAVAGVTFFDTADVYGDARSEEFCGRLP